MVESQLRVIDSRPATLVDQLPPSQLLSYFGFDEFLLFFDVAVGRVFDTGVLIRTWSRDLQFC